MTVFSRGQIYPLDYPKQDAAVADFLRSGGNRLLIALSGMTSAEEQSFRGGMITAGFKYLDGALLWLFRFYGKDGQPLFTFDAPFDARLIPTEELQLHNIDNVEQRLLIDLHAVDDNGILRAIRAVTMSQGMTLAFLSAVQEQLATTPGKREGEYRMKRWMQQQPDELANSIKMEALGR
ncbi:hypothetical protein ACQE3D_25495 (plasmid) [Methylomonas sp. MS20]|uniref:hypothetical protein n=1 Tax=Methylomonas sp. MS20 TaxID=3418769 RepID=UPI003CFF993A